MLLSSACVSSTELGEPTGHTENIAIRLLRPKCSLSSLPTEKDEEGAENAQEKCWLQSFLPFSGRCTPSSSFFPSSFSFSSLADHGIVALGHINKFNSRTGYARRLRLGTTQESNVLSPSCATGCCTSAVTSGDAACAEGRLGSETSLPPTAVHIWRRKGSLWS